MLSGYKHLLDDDNFDSCCVIQCFEPGTTDTAPSRTWLVPSLKMEDGTELGVVGFKAITSLPGGNKFHGVL